MTGREEEAAGILERGLDDRRRLITQTPDRIRKLESAMRRALGKLRGKSRHRPFCRNTTMGGLGRFKRCLTPRKRTAHEKCRDDCTREMRNLKNLPGVIIKITVRSLDPFIGGAAGRYEVCNMYGNIWTGKACCKWRAKAKAAKALISRKG